MEFDVTPKTSGIDELDGKLFSIENNYFIFDLLRNKMYEDPVLAICREICCNARDANRDNNKSNVPIKVKLPTTNSLYFEVSDSGKGISPELIDTVFIKYAASTKRNDNNQTGGFGLGAKTPFAYSDSFTVITVSNNIKYQYLCYIDETKVGKMSLISSNETNEESGTTIVIPVQQKDISLFINKFSKSVEFWDVLPKANIALTFNNFKSLKFGTWYFGKQLSYGDNLINVIIDGICYPVSDKKITNLFTKSNYVVYLSFNNGELSLTPNRENLHYDEKTINSLNLKIKKSSEELCNFYQNKINLCQTYEEAIKLKIDSVKFSPNLDLKYKSFKVLSSFDVNLNSAIKNVSVTQSSGRNYKSITNSYFLDIQKNLIVDDYGLEDKQIKNVINKLVLKINKSFQLLKKSDLDNISSIIPVEALDIEKLSNLVTKPRNRKASNKIIYLKYNDTKFSRVSYSEIESDTKTKVFCELYENKELKSSKVYRTELKEILNEEYSVYGLIEPTKEILEEIEDDFLSIDSVIESVLKSKENEINLYLESKEKSNSVYVGKFKFYPYCKEIQKFLNHKNDYIDGLCLINSMQNSYKFSSELDTLIKINSRCKIIQPKYNSISFNDQVLIEQEKEFFNSYKLLTYLNTYYFDESCIEEIAKFINNEYERKNKSNS